jgi:GNAT superfamily N-acetyltransferase
MSGTIIETSIGDYVVSTDPLRVDVDIVHDHLAHESYWAEGRTREVVVRSVANSALVAGVYDTSGAMVGFGRMVTDLATFAWLCDVFVLDDHRGHRLGVALARILVEHPAVVDVKRQLLATRDAHELYRRFGYGPLDDPGRWMARPGRDR